MAEQDKIDLLHQKLDFLINRQNSFQKEILDLKKEIETIEIESFASQKTPEIVSFSKENRIFEKPIQPKETIAFSKQALPKSEPRIKKPSNWEKFIGENLINKLGILILVIGVGIGAKYAIDNEWISPLTRIILGYFAGLGLLGFALKLKQKFEGFSAVLLSGSMAIMYFITFLAYSLYGLIPQNLAFLIMVIFTGFTVFASLKYNQQVIAIIGLVGAYFVPFLLSDGSGKVLILFMYMTLINIGILIIAFQKYWRLLNIISFCATWLIFSTWFFSSFDAKLHFTTAVLFLFLFFAIFYSAFLSYKLIRKENYEARDIFSVLSNSFVFYGIGIGILNDHPVFTQYLGLFTLLNAIIHFGVSLLIYKKKLADKSLFYLIIGLVLTFITLAIPIQLDGKWVTLAWAFQGSLLFWLARTQKVPLYEKLSYIVLVLAFISLLEDWSHYSDAAPIFNANFLNSLLFTVIFGFVFYTQRKFPIEETPQRKQWSSLVKYFIPAVCAFVVFNAIKIEISRFWNIKYEASKMQTALENSGYFWAYNTSLMSYKVIWILNFSMVYLIALILVTAKIKDHAIQKGILFLSCFGILAFITQGLFRQSQLIHNYMNPENEPLFKTGVASVSVHYLSLVILGILAYAVYKQYVRHQEKNKTVFEILFSALILWILSAEMLIWIHAFNSWTNSKLGLSILWGIVSLVLISYGIWKNRKHLRLAAIVLFGITLVKLFIYDIAHLNTIRKTIVFVSLGILLLVISFLYNKYKNRILDEDKT